MLRRIADNLFWAARNLERAEWRARLVDVNYHLLIETPPRDSAPWEPLLASEGVLFHDLGFYVWSFLWTFSHSRLDFAIIGYQLPKLVVIFIHPVQHLNQIGVIGTA